MTLSSYLKQTIRKFQTTIRCWVRLSKMKKGCNPNISQLPSKIIPKIPTHLHFQMIRWVYSSKRLNSSIPKPETSDQTHPNWSLDHHPSFSKTLHVGSDENFGPSSCSYPICSLLLVREEVRLDAIASSDLRPPTPSLPLTPLLDLSLIHSEPVHEPRQD
jgi:hypothetical protein